MTKRIVVAVMAAFAMLAAGPAAAQEVQTCESGQININTAGFEELRDIIHIDEDRAQQILDLRPFSSVEDMTRISGIAEQRLADIQEQGLACAEPQPGDDDNGDDDDEREPVAEDGELAETGFGAPVMALIAAGLLLSGGTVLRRTSRRVGKRE